MEETLGVAAVGGRVLGVERTELVVVAVEAASHGKVMVPTERVSTSEELEWRGGGEMGDDNADLMEESRGELSSLGGNLESWS